MKTNKKLLELTSKLEKVQPQSLVKQPSTVKSRENKKFIKGLRSISYSNAAIFGELIDNSRDAGAKNINIHFFTTEDGNVNFYVVDDGKGMSPKLLETAVEFGSATVKTDEELGKFGIGISTSTIALGTKREIITKEIGSSVLSYERFQLSAIPDNDVWCPSVYKASKSHENLYRYFNLNGSGTIVRISEVDRIEADFLKKFELVLLRYIGETYREILKKINIYVNGHKATPIDPLLRNDKRVTVLDKGIIDIGNGFTINYIGVLFPHGGVVQKYRNEKIYDSEIHAVKRENMGVFLLRNERQIDRAILHLGDYRIMDLGNKPRNYHRLRIELSVSSKCDEALGIVFTKNKSANADIEAVTAIRKIIQKIQKKAKAIVVNDTIVEKLSEEEERSEVSRNMINSKLKGKVKPVEMNDEDNSKTPKKKTEKKLPNNKPRKKTERLADLVEFTLAKLGVNGPHFDFEQITSRKTRVIWNVEHEFYINYIQNLNDDGAVAVYLNAFAWARAVIELNAENYTNEPVLDDFMQKTSILLQKYYK